MSKIFKRTPRKRFCENICNLFFGVHIHYFTYFLGNLISYEMVFNWDVFSFRMHDWIFIDTYRTSVITVNSNGIIISYL
jgi:hypothetical protein